MSRKLPPLETDEAARRFLESTDLTDYLDRATMAPLTREFEAKDTASTLRPSEALLADIKKKASSLGRPVQKLVRITLEHVTR
jgi:predicted DNA binding CopG/RHH family protein